MCCVIGCRYFFLFFFSSPVRSRSLLCSTARCGEGGKVHSFLDISYKLLQASGRRKARISGRALFAPPAVLLLPLHFAFRSTRGLFPSPGQCDAGEGGGGGGGGSCGVICLRFETPVPEGDFARQSSASRWLVRARFWRESGAFSAQREEDAETRCAFGGMAFKHLKL